MKSKLFDVPAGRRVAVLLSGSSVSEGGKPLGLDREHEVCVTLTDDFKMIDGLRRRRAIGLAPPMPRGEIWLSNAECEQLLEHV